MKKRWQNNFRPGFTLAETMVSLMIMALAFVIVEMTLASWSRTTDDFMTINFDRYLDVIEGQRYKLRTVHAHGLTLVDRGRKFIVKPLNNKIILTTRKGGYVPLLKNVRSVDWRYSRSTLISRVTMENGCRLVGKSGLEHE